MSEQEAHEAACPFAICQRIMAPLQARNQQLQAQQLAAGSVLLKLQAQNQQLQSRCDGLQSKCQELHRQVAALQPLAGRVRALEGVGTEEGGRRQRQRVGPAPHDAPPSDAAVAQLGVVDAVQALWTHGAVARVAEKACEQIRSLILDPRGCEQAAAAGAIEAVVAAMLVHPQEAGVQEWGCTALVNLSIRSLAQRAADAGAIEAVVGAMRAHVQVNELQYHASSVLSNVCAGDHAAARARQLQAANAGGVEALVGAMEAHAQDEYLQEGCCGALRVLCRRSASVAARALQAGGRGAVAAAMQAYPGNEELQDDGQELLDLLVE